MKLASTTPEYENSVPIDSWIGEPWPTLSIVPQGISIAIIHQTIQHVYQFRTQLLILRCLEL